MPIKIDEKHHSWKGDNVGYDALHKWIERKLGKPSECKHCFINNLPSNYYHWANISREYRRDLNDWIRLCSKCHSKFDNIGEKISTKLKGRIITGGWRKKISETRKKLFKEDKLIHHMLGKHLSEETKKKMSMSLKGRIGCNKGKKCPEISKRLMGRKLSDETKRKISIKRKEFYKKIKNIT